MRPPFQRDTQPHAQRWPRLAPHSPLLKRAAAAPTPLLLPPPPTHSLNSPSSPPSPPPPAPSRSLRPFLANSPFSRVCCCSACAWRVPDSRLNKQAARSRAGCSRGVVLEKGGPASPGRRIALKIGGVGVDRFGVTCPGILLKTWKKAQARVRAEKVTPGSVEVRDSGAPVFLFSPPTLLPFFFGGVRCRWEQKQISS